MSKEDSKNAENRLRNNLLNTQKNMMNLLIMVERELQMINLEKLMNLLTTF